MTKSLKVFCDGGARGNPGPAAIGFVVKDSQGQLVHQHGESIGKATNNVAEYQAVILALRWLSGFLCLRSSIKRVDFYLDSKLVVNQARGLFKIKKEHLKKHFSQLKWLEGQLKIVVDYHHIPREKNFLADRLLNQAMDNPCKV